MKVWSCKIGETDSVPKGGDFPMREAVSRAYLELTGEEPAFLFSGWGAELTESERAVVEDRLPATPARSPVDNALDRLYVMADRAAGKDVRAADLAAITTVRKELERLRDERDAALDREAGTSDAFDDMRADRDSYDDLLGRKMAERDEWHKRAESAEAELKLARDGLRWVEQMTAGRAGVSGIADHVRALLAASPPDGKPVPVESLLDDEDYEVMREDGGGAK